MSLCSSSWKKAPFGGVASDARRCLGCEGNAIDHNAPEKTDLRPNHPITSQLEEIIQSSVIQNENYQIKHLV
jgi:hypothetical protein